MRDMAKSPTALSIAADLAIPERLLLFCLATSTDRQAAITHAAAEHMLVHGLIERGTGATSFRLTDQGRAALTALLSR
jgi:hypothetical protein